jgi:cell division septation protein DedD
MAVFRPLRAILDFLYSLSEFLAALNMIAGQPVKLSVVALRRETVTEPQAAPEPEPLATGALDAPSDIETGTIDDLAATAAAALDDTPPAAEPAPAPAPAPQASGLAKPYVQIGIFSVEQNAQNTATAMRQAGMVPTVRKQTSKGKTFWRVLVGPAQTKSEINALLKAAKAKGFADAYAVSN